jgi:hypothetical protein
MAVKLYRTLHDLVPEGSWSLPWELQISPNDKKFGLMIKQLPLNVGTMRVSRASLPNYSSQRHRALSVCLRSIFCPRDPQVLWPIRPVAHVINCGWWTHNRPGLRHMIGAIYCLQLCLCNVHVRHKPSLPLYPLLHNLCFVVSWTTQSHFYIEWKIWYSEMLYYRVRLVGRYIQLFNREWSGWSVKLTTHIGPRSRMVEL